MKKYDNFYKSLTNLKTVYSYQKPYTPVELAGIVNLFFICFESSWKLMKNCLEKQGITDLRSPRAVLKAACQYGLINDEEAWLQALNDRNIAAHVYDSSYEPFVQTIKELYIPLFEKFYQNYTSIFRN